MYVATQIRVPCLVPGFGLFIATVLLGWSPPGTTPARGHPSAEEKPETKVYGTWYEYDQISAGKTVQEHGKEPFGLKFGKDETEIWELGGELSMVTLKGGVKIDTTTNPWRLDQHIRNEKGAVSVIPGIFKFEGDDLILVTGYPGEASSDLNKSGEYKIRPTGFTSTKDNRYTVVRLKRCDYLQTDFPKDPPKRKK